MRRSTYSMHGRGAPPELGGTLTEVFVVRGATTLGVAHWHDPLSQIEAEGEAEPQLRLLIGGWAAKTRMLPDGRRQFVRILIPGDFCGGVGQNARSSTIALTRARTLTQPEFVDAGRGAASSLDTALATAESREYVGLVDHIVRLGRMSAYERTAHLLLELFHRQRQAGLTQGDSMPLPINQEMLADALGLSIVHTNRVLQQLRRDGFIVSRPGRVAFQDAEALRLVCGYAPTSDPTGFSYGADAPQHLVI